jgi:acetate---CoA ligase (ADP-forming)
MTQSMSGTGAVRGAAAVEYFLRPRSVAIIGISSRPGSAGMNALANFTLNDFAGDIYLVGRSGGEIEGRKVFTEIDELPEGVELAIFTLPAAGVHDAMRACARRKVRAVTIFASGFAEVGERQSQDELAQIARDGGVALLGPNCLGYTNFTNGVTAGFVAANKVVRTPDTDNPKVAIISASGGLMGHIRMGLEQRDIPAAYTISTGNEAGIGLPDFVEYLAHDPLISLILVYVEEVREPQAFLEAAALARSKGKPVVMMHPGRTDRAREAVSSHTGALAGNHAVMRTLVEHAGIMLIDNLDELIDTAEILARYPEPTSKGPGILTFSGAFCALAHDFCEEIGIELPPLSAEGEKELRAALPGFATPRNPLDLTTQPVWQPDLMRTGASALLDDPNVGSLVISIPMGNPKLGVAYLNYTLEATAKQPSKPMVFSCLGERSPLPQDFLDLAKQNKVILSRSADRSLRAIKHISSYGGHLERAKKTVAAQPIANMPKFGEGSQAEWLGKQALQAAGMQIPAGGLARSADEAVEIAKRVGFPVAMKAQAAKLAHKTEAGGVLLNIADEAGVRAAWQTLHDNVKRYNASIVLDGALVEVMSKKGLEFVVGARRDPGWGPVVLVGLGGVMIEAIGDVRLMPPDLSQEAIVDEIMQLKSAKLLKGFRGAPPADVEAIAKVAQIVGSLMRTNPDIMEIDINPLIVHGKGEGVTALDALFVMKGGEAPADHH